MGSPRKNGKRGDSGRDGGGFVALPWSVLDCPAYAGLSMHARGLLLEVARQFVRDNNGRLLLSTAYLKVRGWHSAGVIQKAKQELLDAGFIFETVKGHRPNRASWYAMTWQALNRHPDFDQGAAVAFQRGAYRFTPGKPKRPAPKCKNPKKNASLNPSHGTENPAIVPVHGIGVLSVVPCQGTVKPIFAPFSIPQHGNHLEMPSPALQVCAGSQ